MEQKTLSIHVIVADRPYPLRIKPEEEALVREAAKLINEKIREFQQQYAAKDKQDYLAMCCMMWAVEHLQQKTKDDGSGQINHLAQEIHDQLTSLVRQSLDHKPTE